MIYQVGEYKDQDAYLRHCMKTVNDMERIVKDILSAARMGGSDFQLERTDLDISRMLQKACRKVMGRIEDKEMELRQDINRIFIIREKHGCWKKVFSMCWIMRLPIRLDGAIVTVTLQDGVLSVENSGIHIEQEDLERLFTPFYRVDKSRNRNSRGSGLGLYITKTILDGHRVSYSMENTENGVRFTALFRLL